NPLGNHVFAQFVRLRKSPKIDGENAQSNTMVCKGNMNLRSEGKKMAGGQASRHRRKIGSTVHLAGLTELTAIVLSFSVPVTVALAPACLSSVASAALSVVSSV